LIMGLHTARRRWRSKFVVGGVATGIVLSAVMIGRADAAQDTTPVARDDSYSTGVNQNLIIGAPGVLANDTDADGDPLHAVYVSGPQHGTVSLSANGAFTYVPHTNYRGPDQFTYKACDPGTVLAPPTLNRINPPKSTTVPPPSVVVPLPNINVPLPTITAPLPTVETPVAPKAQVVPLPANCDPATVFIAVQGTGGTLPPPTTPPAARIVVCAELARVGIFDVRSGDPLYRTYNDRDNDGIACERFPENQPPVINNNTTINNPPTQTVVPVVPAVPPEVFIRPPITGNFGQIPIESVPSGPAQTGDGSLVASVA
jgi:hypothetical protein